MEINVVESIGILISATIATVALVHTRKQMARAEKDRLQANIDRIQAQKDREADKLQAQKDKEAEALYYRLEFLSNIIFNSNIPKKDKQVFYDEYVAKGGNGSTQIYWLGLKE